MTIWSSVNNDLASIFNTSTSEFAINTNHTTPAGTVTAISVVPLGASVDTLIGDFSDNTEDSKAFMSLKSEIIVAEGDKITFESKSYKIQMITAQDDSTQTFDAVYKTKEKAHGRLQ